MKNPRHLLALLATVLTLGASQPSEASPLRIVASFSIIGDMIANIGGDRIDIKTIVGPNADTHVYEPTPGDAVAVAGAALYFVNGLGFDGWMQRLIEATASKGQMIVLGDAIAARTMQEDGKSISDPHAWQSLQNAGIYVKEIANALCVADPADCPFFTANQQEYAAKIESLDQKVRAEIALIPEANRKIVTSHDAFGYFGAEYGVRFLAPAGFSTDSEPSAGTVARLVEQIRAENVTTLFVENMSDPRLIEQIAHETGAHLGGALFADALSKPGEGGATFLEMFRHNVTLLVKAMQAAAQ